MMDNHHVSISNSPASCGVLELSNYKNNKNNILFALASYLYHPSRGIPAAFVMWSDVKGDSNGEFLKQFIEENFLYSIVLTTPYVENPKTSNFIRVYIWNIPHVEFKKWYIEKRIERVRNI